MVNIISTASELGYLNVPDNTLIEIDQMKNYPPEKMVADHNRKTRENLWLTVKNGS